MKTPTRMLVLSLLVAACTTCKKPAARTFARFRGDVQALALASHHLPPQPVILEAGSYHGETALEMVKRWPQATVYSFEPVPELLAIVKQNTAAFPNIHVSDLALSDRIGSAVFHLSAMAGKPEESLGSGSLLAPKHHREGFPHVKFERTITVATTTIDAWAKRAGVAKLDFIWLDIQGTELPVLKAAPDIMKTVKVVITEVEFVEMYAGQALFAEIRPWFEAQGFELAGADFAPDAPDRADLKSRNAVSWYGNALFVRKPSR